jgi:hypothetical protein
VTVLSSKQAKKQGRISITKSAHGRQPISEVKQGVTPDALRKKDLDTLKRLDELTATSAPGPATSKPGPATSAPGPATSAPRLAEPKPCGSIRPTSTSSTATLPIVASSVASLPTGITAAFGFDRMKPSAVKQERVTMPSAGDKRPHEEVTSCAAKKVKAPRLESVIVIDLRDSD